MTLLSTLGRGLTGNLSSWPCAGLFTWLNNSGQSAVVTLHLGTSPARVYFRRGTLIRCEWGELQGERALRAILRHREGHFSIHRRPVSTRRTNITRSVTGILLEYYTQYDEQRVAA